MGRVRKSFRRSCHHGRVFFHDHDCAIQGAGSRAGLAKRSNQVVAAAEAEASSLRLREVSKSFPAPDDALARHPALQSVSLSLAAGELVSLIGPSGCGKSTLLRLIAGLDSPDSGEVFIGSEPIKSPGAERGLVFQDPSLFPWLTVRGNIEAGFAAPPGFLQKQ